MASGNSTTFVPLDVPDPGETPAPQPSPGVPYILDDSGHYVPAPTSSPTAKPTRTPRPQPSVTPSVSNPEPTTIARSVQFPTTIKMQPIWAGGRSLPYPVGKPGVNVYQPVTGGNTQPILTSNPSLPKSKPLATTVSNTVPLFGTGVPATRGRMPRVLPGQQKSVTSNTGGTGDSQHVNRTSLPDKKK